MDEIIKILLIMLISSVKFLAGPPVAYYGQLSDYSFIETNVYCIAGGTAGILFFMYLSKHVLSIFKLIKIKHEPPQKIFTKRNRKLVRFWQSYGLIGIALITPVILSIPIGTIIATRLISDKKKIFVYLFGSVILWSLILTILMELFEEIPFDVIVNESI